MRKTGLNSHDLCCVRCCMMDCVQSASPRSASSSLCRGILSPGGWTLLISHWLATMGPNTVTSAMRWPWRWCTSSTRKSGWASNLLSFMQYSAEFWWVFFFLTSVLMECDLCATRSTGGSLPSQWCTARWASAGSAARWCRPPWGLWWTRLTPFLPGIAWSGRDVERSAAKDAVRRERAEYGLY